MVVVLGRPQPVHEDEGFAHVILCRLQIRVVYSLVSDLKEWHIGQRASLQLAKFVAVSMLYYHAERFRCAVR